MAHDIRQSWHDRPLADLTTQFRTDVQLGFVQEYRAEHAVLALARLTTPRAGGT
jgi:hypothetical protein